MVIVKEDKNLIQATAGDTIILNIAIEDNSGNAYTPAPEDKIIFAVKKSYEDDEPVLVKEIPPDTCQLRIEGWETHDIEPGDFVFEVSIVYGGDIISTIIPNEKIRTAKLKLLSEVV